MLEGGYCEPIGSTPFRSLNLGPRIFPSLPSPFTFAFWIKIPFDPICLVLISESLTKIFPANSSRESLLNRRAYSPFKIAYIFVKNA